MKLTITVIFLLFFCECQILPRSEKTVNFDFQPNEYFSVQQADSIIKRKKTEADTNDINLLPVLQLDSFLNQKIILKANSKKLSLVLKDLLQQGCIDGLIYNKKEKETTYTFLLTGSTLRETLNYFPVMSNGEKFYISLKKPFTLLVTTSR